MSSDPDPQLSFGDLPRGRGTPEDPRTYSVSELVRRASQRLESRFADVWVEGEVSNLKTPSSGHCYFTLKDARAQLAVVMFRSAAARLRFRLEDGQQLRCRGRLGIYDAQGRFQLTAETAEPAGLGALQLAFEQLKRKLDSEGLFEARHKRPLPRLPRAVAVVTSPTGAALRDIIRVLHGRCPVRVVVCPTPVQGSEAPGEIVRALGRADQLGADLVILGRGGGSLEDLQAFNNEGVARAIFHLRTPIISAVGHEVDLTIADLVSDRRAPTPSAAAEMAVPVMEEVLEQLRSHQRRLSRAMEHQIRQRALELERMEHRLGSPLVRLNRGRMALDDAGATLQSSVTRLLGQRRARLHRLQTRLARQEVGARLGRWQASLDRMARSLTDGLQRGMARRRAAIEQMVARLAALSPLSVLERGYGLVLDENGRIISDIGRVAVGQSLRVRLSGGTLHVRVEQLRPGPPPGCQGIMRWQAPVARQELAGGAGGSGPKGPVRDP